MSWSVYRQATERHRFTGWLHTFVRNDLAPAPDRWSDPHKAAFVHAIDFAHRFPSKNDAEALRLEDVVILENHE
jgi:hypothetical protein